MYQKLIIAGFLGRDPEMRFTPAGEPVTSFSVASSRQYTGGNGERVQETTWFQVTAWGKQAEACHKFLHKGSPVLVEGRLTPDKVTGGPRMFEKRDGGQGTSYELTAATVRFLGSQETSSATQAAPAFEDDIPF